MNEGSKKLPEKRFDSSNFLKNLTKMPGIYKMLDVKGEIIYIGKARNLKNRVSSYFRSQSASPKQTAMVSKVADIEVMVTHTEGEALLLESQQIKQHKPRYNICLRDDKSYPFIYISSHQDFPRISFHRGAKKKQGKYFGPYPSAGAVRETLKLIQKIFPVRQCEDSYYKNRTRPCLQYQIERCTAPCVDLICKDEYAVDVQNTIWFLEGKSDQLVNRLIEKMEKSSEALDYEHAAQYRDQIVRIRAVLEKQFIHGERGDVDIVACALEGMMACVQVFFIRNGQQLGNKTFFPKLNDGYLPGQVIQAFIAQYYLDKQIPYEILVSEELEETDLLCEMLSQRAGHSVAIATRLRGDRARWMNMAHANAGHALRSKLADKQGIFARFLNLQEILACDELPKRLECFDISHTQGDQTVASCVVFNQDGPFKSDYRRFNIEGIAPGDDYAAIAQAVKRRFERMKKGEHIAPDILFIDGGKGQVGEAKKVLSELDINNVMIVGVSKGPDRKPGMEKIILAGENCPIDVPGGSSGLLLIQHIRDEAHRFAITGHRQRRAKAKTRSILEDINGLGPKRRQLLLKQFGGLQGVSRAGVEALSSVDGISKNLAQRIYDTFHQQQHDG